jgi:hypothetical protein
MHPSSQPLKDIPSLPMKGSNPIMYSFPPPSWISWRGVFPLQIFRKDLPSIGSINSCAYILVYLVISIDYLPLIDIYGYGISWLVLLLLRDALRDP